MDWFKNWFDSKYYHILYGSRDEDEANDFITNVLGTLLLPSDAKILDLACGNGRHSNILAKHSFEIHGSDLSENNIDLANQSNIGTLKVGDMRKVYLANYFDLVLNLFTSFGYFEDENDNLLTLSAVCENLKPNAAFVQDYFNVHYVKSILNTIDDRNIDGILFRITKTIDNNQIVKTISFETEGKPYVFYEKVNLYQLSDFESMYEKVGLKIENVYGDYDLSPFDNETSKRLIIISTKK